ncbi:MAG TPA: PH domain-containing protein [Streptosporangiaceae bacterium]
MRIRADDGRVPSAVANVLLPHEREVLILRHHPALLLPPVAIAIGGLFAAGALTGLLRTVPIAVTIVWLLWFGALGYLMLRTLDWSVNRLLVTDKRIMYLSGVITRKIVMSPLRKVTDLNLNRSWLGEMLGYGTILLDTTGQYDELRNVPFMPHPEEVFIEVSALIFPDRDKDDD